MVRSNSFLLGLFEASTMRFSLSFLMRGMFRACGRMGLDILEANVLQRCHAHAMHNNRIGPITDAYDY